MSLVSFPHPPLPPLDDPAGATLWVDGLNGLDGNPGTEGSPKQTIQAAVNAAANGTTVMVLPTAVYHEFVDTSAKSGTLTIRTADPDVRPIIDGDHARLRCILFNGSSLNLSILGMEIRNATYAGIQGGNLTARYNVVHDVLEQGSTTPTDVNIQGIKVNYANSTVTDNLIYNCGQAGEARGILLMSHDSVVERNVIVNARKEGIRDAGPSVDGLTYGYDNVIRDNTFMLCWIGIASNSALGTRIENNVVAYCQFGVNPKHHATSAARWQGLTMPVPRAQDATLTRWCKVHHNTFIQCAHASIQNVVNMPYGDFYSYQDNLVCDAGAEYVWEFPNQPQHGPNQVWDNNVYVTSGNPRPPGRMGRMNGYTDNSYVASLPDLKAWTNSWSPYEEHGQGVSFSFVSFRNYNQGNYDYDGTLVGADLGDGYGTQIGARGVPAAPVRWTQINAVSATASNNNANANRMNNDNPDTYWNSGSGHDNDSTLTFDLGSVKTFTHFKYAPFNHAVNYNLKSFDLSFSENGVDYTAPEHITLNDYEGSSFYWVLDDAVTARYVKLTNVTDFGVQVQGVVISDFAVGALTLPNDTTAYVTPGGSEPVPDTTPPSVPDNLASANITATGFDFSWDPSTDDVAVDHYVYRIVGTGETGNSVSTASTGFTFVTDDPAAVTYTVYVKAVDTSNNESAEASLAVDKPEDADPQPPGPTPGYWGVLSEPAPV